MAKQVYGTGFIRPLKHTHLLIHTVAILIGLIIIAIQINTYFRANTVDHDTSFMASEWIVYGSDCR